MGYIASVFQNYVVHNIRFGSSQKLSGGKDEHRFEFLIPLSQKPFRGILIFCLDCFRCTRKGVSLQRNCGAASVGT